MKLAIEMHRWLKRYPNRLHFHPQEGPFGPFLKDIAILRCSTKDPWLLFLNHT